VRQRKPLWAPWRMDYLKGDRSGECIFCEPAQPRSDSERLILRRGSHTLVLLNRYPYSPGHLMVAPYFHTGSLEALEPVVRTEMMACLAEGAAILRETYQCEGMNVGANLGSAAGAGFADHLHFHLVPRWEGDVNFMTCLAETRVIPEHLETTFEELSKRYQERI